MNRQHVAAYRGIIALGVLSGSATLNLSLAQGPTMMGDPGNWMVQTPAKGGCLGLVLQIIRDGGFTITMTQVDGKGPQGTITGGRDPSGGGFLAQVTASGCPDRLLKIAPYAPQGG
jgi:hypothetical protein